MPKESLNYIRHIFDECAYLLAIGKNLTLEQLLADETLKRAVTRSLEIIGEAAKKVPAADKSKWHFIEWKSMAGMRDRLIHDYIGINYAIVLDVIQHKIPPLYTQVGTLLKQE